MTSQYNLVYSQIVTLCTTIIFPSTVKQLTPNYLIDTSSISISVKLVMSQQSNNIVQSDTTYIHKGLQ